MFSNAPGKSLNEYVKDYVVFDLETTGISCSFDEVIEISAVKVVNETVVDEFSTLVNPGRHIPEEASDVNGITDDMVKNAPGFKPVLKEFVDFVGELPLVGHNINSFDMKFIYRDLNKFFGMTISNDYIDTLKISRAYLKELKHHRLVDLASYYGIDTTGAHRALNDCRMNQKIFFCLSGEMTEEKKNEKGIITCPKCGAVMVQRTGVYGPFYGCSGYPVCKFTKNIKATDTPKTGKKSGSAGKSSAKKPSATSGFTFEDDSDGGLPWMCNGVRVK